jgi:hypothetical protein
VNVCQVHFELIMMWKKGKIYFHSTHHMFQNQISDCIVLFRASRFNWDVESYLILKNVIIWDVALCRSCVNRRFRGKYRLYLQGRKIRKRWTSVSRWLQTEPPVRNNQLYKNGERGRVCHMGIQQSGEGCGVFGEDQQQVAEGCV